MSIADKFSQESAYKWTPEDIAEACEVTAELLEGHWTKTEWFYSDGENDYYCLEGALGTALGLDVRTLNEDSEDRHKLVACPVSEAIEETIRIRHNLDIERGEIPTWNDAEVRTEAEVLDILHLTAKRVLGVDVTPVIGESA